MTESEVKKRLISARIAQKEYALALEKANCFDMMISSPKSGGFGERSADSTGKNKTEEKLLLALSYHEKAKALEQKMIDARRDVEEYITLLSLQSEREIITRRYLMCQTWEQIAASTGYSVRQTTRLHTKALEKISERCP